MNIKSILLSTILSLSICGTALAIPPPPAGYTWEVGPFGPILVPITIPTPTPVQITSPDPITPLSDPTAGKELAPTSLNPDITNTMGYNLAGRQTEITPLEKTMIVNNIDTNEFAENSVGAIAINGNDQPVIAVSEFTPVAAASQVDNNGMEVKYDFVIQTPIVE